MGCGEDLQGYPFRNLGRVDAGGVGEGDGCFFPLDLGLTFSLLGGEGGRGVVLGSEREGRVSSLLFLLSV